MLRGKFIVLNEYFRREERSKVKKLCFHLGKKKKRKLEASRREEVIKIRAEINEIANRKTVEKVNETKC